MIARWLLVALAFAPGCRQIFGIDPPTGTLGDAAAPDAGLASSDDGYRSGTRLKLQWNAYGPTREYTGIYDTTLAATCTPTLWADGNTYCVPPTGNFTGYLDASCTMPIALVEASTDPCAPPISPWVVSRDFSCGAESYSHLYGTGAVYAAQPPYYEIQSGVCSGPFTNDFYTVYRVTTEIPTTGLVQQALLPLPGGRLVQQVYAGSDGSLVRAGVQDTMLGAACTPDGVAETCAPAITSLVYADDTCATAVATQTKMCPTPAFGAAPLHPDCAIPDVQYFHTGAASDAPSFYFNENNAACVAIARDDNTNYFTLSTQVTTAALTTRLGSGAGGIVRSYFNDGTSDVGPISLYDTVHHTACRTASNGQCLPAGLGALPTPTYYADAACATPAVFSSLYTGAPGCAVPAVPPYVIQSSTPVGSCTATFHVFNAGAPTTNVYEISGSPATCVKVTMTGGVFISTGAEVPLAQFATATSGMDP